MNVQALSNFQANLRQAMQLRGLSQRQIAIAAELSYPYVNRILTSKVEPTLPVCDRLADAVKISLVDLLRKPAEFSRVAG
jgi:transcriptional regulator with XRE-family HTH domain